MKFAKSTLAFLPGLLGTLVWLSPRPVQAGENLWTSHGPSGPVQYLAAAPTDARTVYAAGVTNSDGSPSIFKSVNGGESWELLSPGDLTSTSINCLAVHPTQPASVFAGIYNFKSNDHQKGDFLKSHDGGAQWESQTLPGSVYPLSIAVDEGTGVIYVGSYSSPVVKSINGGTWINTALAAPQISYTLLADSLNQTLLVGAAFSYEDSWGLYGYGGNVGKTTDGGASWSFGSVDLGSPVVTLAKDSRSDYYAGTADGVVYRSSDRAATWARLATLPGPIGALAADPTNFSVLYAATPNRGVLRSTDGGLNWRSFNAGMASRNVTSLTIDSTGQVLHVGTDLGVFDMAIAGVPEPAPCNPGADHLCLFGSRFRVDLTAIDPFTKAAFEANAVPGNSRSGYFTFPSLTGDATFPEVIVKMVDATSLPGAGYWVYYSSMTSLLYTLKITDTTTGVAREYSGEDSCGGADVTGFLPVASATSATPAPAATATQRILSSPDLMLLDARFRVTLTAHNPATDVTAPGVAIPQDNRFGSFSLPAFTSDPELPEVFVKMIDAGGGSFLFYYTGLTSLDYSITVFDTVTETERTYVSQDADPERACGGGELLMLGE